MGAWGSCGLNPPCGDLRGLPAARSTLIPLAPDTYGSGLMKGWGERIKCDTTRFSVKLLLPPRRLRLQPLVCPLAVSARSKFYVREPLHDKPDWLKVGLTLGTSVVLWSLVSLAGGVRMGCWHIHVPLSSAKSLA